MEKEKPIVERSELWKQHRGKCALCGKECELTYEHIPPKAAFNSKPITTVTSDVYFNESNINRLPWETSGMKYINQQKGMGLYSLCSDCNSGATGSKYGDAYKEFAYRTVYMFRTMKENDVEVDFYDIFPLRIIKQICSMFCSINADCSFLDDMKEFVLNPKSNNFNKNKYRIQMYFNKGNIIKYHGYSVILKYDEWATEISEIVAPPFGFQLIIDPRNDHEYAGINITDFADCDYNSKATIRMPIKFYESNNIFPDDFRTKDEILLQMNEAKKHLQNNMVIDHESIL